jgi:hypothetical protein
MGLFRSLLGGLHRSCTVGVVEPCRAPSLSRARDLGIVRCVPGDGVLELNAFKFRNAIPEHVQTTRASRSGWETKGQVTGSDDFSAPTAPSSSDWSPTPSTWTGSSAPGPPPNEPASADPAADRATRTPPRSPRRQTHTPTTKERSREAHQNGHSPGQEHTAGTAPRPEPSTIRDHPSPGDTNQHSRPRTSLT